LERLKHEQEKALQEFLEERVKFHRKERKEFEEAQTPQRKELEAEWEQRRLRMEREEMEDRMRV